MISAKVEVTCPNCKTELDFIQTGDGSYYICSGCGYINVVR